MFLHLYETLDVISAQCIARRAAAPAPKRNNNESSSDSSPRSKWRSGDLDRCCEEWIFLVIVVVILGLRIMALSDVPLMSAISDQVEGLIVSNDSGSVLYRGKPCTVVLDQNSFVVKNMDARKKPLVEIPSSTLIGMKYSAAPPKSKWAFNAQFYFYPVATNCFGSKAKENNRVRKELQLAFNTEESVLTQWSAAIQAYVAGKTIASIDAFEAPAMLARKFVVFVNPKSGSGIAMKIWTRTVEPMFSEAGISVQLIVTQYANHAKEYVMDLNHLGADVEAVVVVGGDGLLFEVVNGIASRPDSVEVFRRVALAPIPGGTGNGLIKSILFRTHEAGTPLNAAYSVIRGISYPIDLSRVLTHTGKTHLSFLSLAWGLIADVDILSESMRFLGELRLYVAAVYFIMARRTYQGRLRMKLVKDYANYRPASFASVSSVSFDAKPPPILRDQDKVNRVLVSDQEGEDGWLTIEGKFMLVFVLQTSHVSMSVHTGPGVEMNDGLFTVMVVQDLGRLGLTSLLLSLDSGEYVNNKYVRIFKCSEYTLEPLTEKGRYSLDGELIDYGFIHGSMLPSYARVKSLF